MREHFLGVRMWDVGCTCLLRRTSEGGWDSPLREAPTSLPADEWVQQTTHQRKGDGGWTPRKPSLSTWLGSAP